MAVAVILNSYLGGSCTKTSSVAFDHLRFWLANSFRKMVRDGCDLICKIGYSDWVREKTNSKVVRDVLVDDHDI